MYIGESPMSTLIMLTVEVYRGWQPSTAYDFGGRIETAKPINLRTLTLS